jgi:ATP-dependent protease ClpP protease subunit
MRNWPFPRHAISAVRRASIVAEFGDAPAATMPSWRLANAAGARPRLYVYDVIGGWDLDASTFVQAVNDIADDAEAIDLHINSPGGFVYDAVAMYEALSDHPAPVHVHVDGLAASAASFLAQIGETRDIAKAGRVMIHDAQVMAWGSPADLREAADLADAVSDDIAGYYADRAGGKPGDWRAAMTATSWYSAAEAVDAGLMDTVKKRKTSGDDAGEDDDGPDNRTRVLRARARITLGG